MNTENAQQNLTEYVTAMIGGQLFGLPIVRVQDVFIPERLTRVPLAPPEIAGVLNLRGRIVTLIDLRRRFGLGERGDGNSSIAWTDNYSSSSMSIAFSISARTRSRHDGENQECLLNL